MKYIGRFFLFLWHMISGTHHYVWSNKVEGARRCTSCRYLRHPNAVLDSLESEGG